MLQLQGCFEDEGRRGEGCGAALNQCSGLREGKGLTLTLPRVHGHASVSSPLSPVWGLIMGLSQPGRPGIPPRDPRPETRDSRLETRAVNS